MRDEVRWSMTVARIGTVSIRIHLFFWLFAAWTLYFAWHAEQAPGEQGNLVPVSGLCIAILALSVLLHECGHWLAARQCGGRLALLVIGPFGGLSHGAPLASYRDELLVSLAGPAANAVLVIVAAALLGWEGSLDPGLWNPLHPVNVIEGQAWVVATKLALWINWCLFLLNLVPAYPFDGGQALQAGLLWRAPQLGQREAQRWVVRSAQLMACLLVVASALTWQHQDSGVATWFALVLLAMFVFVGSEYVPARDSVTAPWPLDFSARPAPESRCAWNARQASGREIAASRPDAALPTWPSPDRLDAAEGAVPAATDTEPVGEADDETVDRILIRVHEQGIDCLSPQELTILRQASDRYRRRIRQQA